INLHLPTSHCSCQQVLLHKLFSTTCATHCHHTTTSLRFSHLKMECRHIRCVSGTGYFAKLWFQKKKLSGYYWATATRKDIALDITLLPLLLLLLLRSS